MWPPGRANFVIDVPLPFFSLQMTSYGNGLLSERIVLHI